MILYMKSDELLLGERRKEVGVSFTPECRPHTVKFLGRDKTGHSGDGCHGVIGVSWEAGKQESGNNKKNNGKSSNNSAVHGP